MNIANGLAHAKKVAGTQQAVACGETHYTWDEFDQRTDALARGLARKPPPEALHLRLRAIALAGVYLPLRAIALALRGLHKTPMCIVIAETNPGTGVQYGAGFCRRSVITDDVLIRLHLFQFRYHAPGT